MIKRANLKQLIKNSTTISSLNILGFATALLIDILIAARFGLGQETDAFFIAFAIPQFLMAIFLVTFNVVLVPEFAQIFLKEGRSILWQISSNMLNLSLLFLFIISVVGSLGSSLWIRVLGAGLNNVTQNLAISLSRYIFLMVLPLGAIEVLKATLNSQKLFTAPAATSLVRNSVVFVTAFFSIPIYGIYALVIAYVLGTWLQLIFLLIVLWRTGFRYCFIWSWRNALIVNILRQFRHPFLSSTLMQSSLIFERFFVSFLPVGLVSALVFARRLMRAVDAIFIGSISTALLPDMSANATTNKLSELKRLLILGIKLTLIITIPATIIIAGLREPIVKLLFQRGAFDQQATEATALLLNIYILSIPFKALIQMSISSYYAVNNTKTPFKILLVMITTTIFLQAIFSFTWGAQGLAAAETLSRVFVAILVVLLIHRHLTIIEKPIIIFIIKLMIAASVTLISLWSVVTTIKGTFPDLVNIWGLTLQITFSIAVTLIVYSVSLWSLQVTEFKKTIIMIFKWVKLYTVKSQTS